MAYDQAMTKPQIMLGAMSGTSADGVDVAVVRITGKGLAMRAELLGLESKPLGKSLRDKIIKIRGTGKVSLAELAEMGRDLTLVYAAAVQKALRHGGIRPAEVRGIAAHGQTLFHASPLTIQWFDPSLLAARTGCCIISDFRRADCAAGGEGAPLVPFADYLLFRDQKINRVLLNIGGIANITYLPAGGDLSEVIAFDTGPGNCLSDEIARREGTLPRGMDLGGKIAGRGKVDDDIVERFLRDPYFQRHAPKSTDGPAMGRIFAQACGKKRLPLADRLATAGMCCAAAVALAIRWELPGKADEIVVAGGGAKNKTIMRMLGETTGLRIRTTTELGVPVEAREAMAFALLGAATMDGVPANVPSVTGAKRAVILGSITPRPISG